jgi:hypothetical protein
MHPANLVEPTPPYRSPKASYFLFFPSHVISPFLPFVLATTECIARSKPNQRQRAGQHELRQFGDSTNGVRTLGELPRREFQCEAPCHEPQHPLFPFRSGSQPHMRGWGAAKVVASSARWERRRTAPGQHSTKEQRWRRPAVLRCRPRR